MEVYCRKCSNQVERRGAEWISSFTRPLLCPLCQYKTHEMNLRYYYVPPLLLSIWMERRRRRASLLSGPTAHLFLCRSFPFPFPRFTTDSTCHHHDSLNNNSSSLPLKNKVSKSGASLAVRHWLEKSERLVSRWAERSAVTRSRPNSSLEASHVHTFSWNTAGGKKNKEDRNTCY